MTEVTPPARLFAQTPQSSAAPLGTINVVMTVDEHEAWLAERFGPATVATNLPTWKQRLLSWEHQGLTVNVLVWTVLGCLMQRVVGTVNQEQLLESLTTFATACGYASPGALCVGAWCAFKAGREKSQ